MCGGRVCVEGGCVCTFKSETGLEEATESCVYNLPWRKSLPHLNGISLIGLRLFLGIWTGPRP